MAILSGFVGVYVLSIWHRALSPDLYKNALDQSEFYTEVTNIIEAQVTYYLQIEGKSLVENLVQAELKDKDGEDRLINREIIVWGINTLITNKTGDAVEQLSQNIGLEENIQSVTESALTNSLGWVKGDVEPPKVLAVIPSVEEVENFETSQLLRNSLQDLAYNTLGFEGLPVCPTKEDERFALRQITKGEWIGVACVSEKITPALKERINQTIPEDALANLEGRLEDNTKLYKLDTLAQGLSDVLLNLSKAKEQVLQIRDDINAVRYVAIGLIIFSVTTSIGAYAVSPKRSSKLLLRIGLIVGGLLSIVGIITSSVLGNKLTELFDFSNVNINSEAISVAQATLFGQSIQSVVVYIGEHISDYVIQNGLIIVGVFGLLYLIEIVLGKGGKDKIKDLYRNLEKKFDARYKTEK